MVFSSSLFVFLFLPLVLALHAAAPAAFRNTLLLAASLVFYAWGEPAFVFVMLASIGANWLFGVLVDRYHGRAAALWIVWLAVAVNIGFLGYYKYANFIVENLNALLARFGAAPLPNNPIPLPIGISFFTFHALSYVIDVYRRDGPAQKNPARLALYISFFPQLVAGPIVRYHDIAPQLGRRRIGAERFAMGARRFIIGLGKKLLIANTLAGPADKIFAIPDAGLDAGTAWLGVVCYTLQIYFDFSGYSDMAIGMAHMFGFHFKENFNYPYVAQSVQDFWRRWHISLSTWFRDYLYIPLGGSRGSAARTGANLLIVFFLCGLWHGAQWNFIIWGLFHGAFLALERSEFLARLFGPARALRRVYVLGVVMAGWVFFRAESAGQAWAFLAAMAGAGGGDGIEFHAALYLDPKVALALLAGVIGSAPVLPWIAKRASPAAAVRPLRDFFWGSLDLAGHAAIFLACAMAMAAGTHNPFIYFRF